MVIIIRVKSLALKSRCVVIAALDTSPLNLTPGNLPQADGQV